MVKKVSRFSAIKRAATCCCICFSKDKQQQQQQQQQQRSSSDKKIKRNRNGHKSFIPIFNEPSSIEKILEDAERQTLSLKPLPSSSSQEIAPPSPKDPFPTKPTTTSSTIVDDQLPPTPKLVSSSSTKIQAAPNKRGFVDVDQVQAPPKLVSSSVVTKIQAANRRGHVDADQAPPPPKLVSSSVTKIQAAYRGYVARRGYKALKGLVRLQGVTKSESVKKQIMNAMKTMQSFSKLQNEIRLLRIQKLESKAFQRQAQLINNNNNNNNRESAAADTQSNEWDDSMLSKHEREARLEKKQEAILLREKAMSYAYTQQHLRYPPHSNSHLPWWWNWIDHKLPLIVLPPTNNNNNSSSSSSFDHHHHHYPSSLKKDTLGGEVSPMSYYPRSRPGSSAAGARKFRPFNNNNNDDSSSLVSCPAFSSPHRHYMEQTASAKAKVRPKSNPRQRMMPGRMSQSPGGGTESSSRRFSFPTTPSISGSSKFRESIEQQGSGGLHDKVDRLSMGSPTSVTSRNILDRKPFNRFV
ncbi:protein IQ-DOMAIN 14-like [Impatiens glandulifera]|uniref:protein IQ-DOMAIN 14-like n=1 Tax=Impatiens glandulifera TaxID=253017 RepID=UPI001FB06641|nr:protein IQ-DOMAIN 14-like [Impatiens glandulifera]